MCRDEFKDEFINKVFIPYHNMMQDVATERLDCIEQIAIESIEDCETEYERMVAAIKLCTITEKEYREREYKERVDSV